MEIVELESIAKNVRRDIVEMIHEAKSGHPGGSLSCTDILVTLFHEKMNLNLDENGNRIDKFILSKGMPHLHIMLFYLAKGLFLMKI